MFRPRSGSARVSALSALAADPDTRSIVLWLLCVWCLTSRPLARALAGNARLPRPLLWWLAPRRWDVRAAVAANPRCPQPLLRWVSLSGNWAVCAAVAGNPSASARVLELVGRKNSPREGMYLAANPSLPSALADRLLDDTDPFVRGVAAAHPAASTAGLSRLADGMTEPAWILNRVAANPSCPSGLSDQLLTWIALGGAANADPTFDPVECTGHPGDTSVPVYTWYRDEASRDRAEQHPLWRVRAEVLSAAGRVPAGQAWELARDPRPEVRRRIARAVRLSLDIWIELRRDSDPEVVRLARAAAPKANGGRRDRRIAVTMMRRFPLAPIAVLAYILHQGVPSPGPAGPVVSSQGPAGSGSQPGAPAGFTRELPGGGSLTCEPLAVDPSAAVVKVSAGSRRLMMHFAGIVVGASGPVLPPDATVPPGQSAQFQLLDGASVLTVTASALERSPEAVVSAGGCGR